MDDLPVLPVLQQEVSLLGSLFLSSRNMDTLQTSIRYRVYKGSGGELVIGRQSDTELWSLMMEAYEESVRHVPDEHVVAAVRELNERVVSKASTEVLSAARFHTHYLRDIESPVPVPLEHAQLMSRKGTKVLRPMDR